VKGINTGYQPAELRKAGIWGVSGRNNTQASQSARGLAQSKTLSRQLATQVFPAGLGVRRPSAAFCAGDRQSSGWCVLSRRILNFRRRCSSFGWGGSFSRCFGGGFRLNGRLRFGRGNFRLGQNRSVSLRFNCGGWSGPVFHSRFFPAAFFSGFCGRAGLFWPCPSGHRQIQGRDPGAPASANRQ